MKLFPVSSTAIKAVGYEGRTLAVRFHTSPTVYYHPGVPPYVYAALLQSQGDSMGAYYNRNIRGRYK